MASPTVQSDATAAVQAFPALVPGQLIRVPTDLLQPDPNQPRKEFDLDALQALAIDIGARGIELPIVIRSDFTIKDGERRWRAAQIARLADVPCIVATARGEEGEDAINWKLDQVADNHHREALGPMDWGRFLRELVEVQGIAVKDVPALLEKRGITMSRSYVSNLIRLLELPDWAQKLVKAGTLTAAHGKHILAAKDSPAAMKSLQDEIDNWLRDEYRGPLTVAEMPGLVHAAFLDAHIDLTRSFGTNVPRFDIKTCSGCPNRKEIGGGEYHRDGVYCLDRACFDKKQSAAPKRPNAAPAAKRTKPATDVKKAASAQQRYNAQKIAQARAIEAIVAKADGKFSLDDLRMIAEFVLDVSDAYAIARRRQWEILTKASGGSFADIKKRIASMGAVDLHGLIVEAVITPEFPGGAELRKTAARHGIDMNALEKAALAELKNPAGKKATPAKKPKAAKAAKGAA